VKNLPYFQARRKTPRAGRAALCVVVMALLLSAAACSGRSHEATPGQPAGVGYAKLDDCGYPVVPPPQGCDKCHGFPPQTGIHPPNYRCYRCHGRVIDSNYNFVQPSLHQSGVIVYDVGCTSCHGWDNGAAPPQNLYGNCGVNQPGVGSHASMRNPTLPVHRVACSNCHDVPLAVAYPGHITGQNKAHVHFKNMATLKGANPTWDGKKCSGVYCHGATLKGGTFKEPVWGDQSGKASQCGACHALTDPSGNTKADCHSCHATTVDANQQIIPNGTHMNGYIDVTTSQGGQK
jgi:predicted CxxxxCH...CXXCH cytochrome family protein